MRIVSLCFTMGYLLLCINVNSQTLLYNVYVANKKSGTMRIHVSREDDSQFSVHCEANVSTMLAKVYTLIQTEYRNGHLQNASVMQKVNDKERDNTKITRQNATYYIERKNKEKSTLKDAVAYSIGLVYHVEPGERKTIFSEKYGVFCPIKEVTPSRYELQMPDGKKVYYTYTDGICTKMQTKQMMMDVRFELAEKKNVVVR